MSFIYPRTIAITRPQPIAGIGLQSYSGLAESNETPIAAGVPASIQLDRAGRKPLPNVPADTDGRGTWRIFFVLPNGTVEKDDVITDDLGIRYQVTNPYRNSLGYACQVEELAA